MGRISIVLADDHGIVRQGVKSLLQNEADFIIVGEASDGVKAVDVTLRAKPDVLIVDMMMPSLNGIEVTRRVSKALPKTKVIILSMYMNEPYVIEALRNGAYGYVLKESDVADLIHAIRQVTTGHHYLHPSLSERAIEAYLEKKQDSSLDPYDTLTTREKEVLHLSIDGYTNSEIAAKLFISPRTAEVHRARILRKLSIHSQTELVKYAMKKGIIPKEE